MVQVIDEKKEISECFTNTEQSSSNEALMKYRSTYLSPDRAKEMYSTLLRIMEKEKLFLDPELTLEALAEKMVINRNMLSQLINQHIGLNFNDFINTYRINEAKRILAESLKKREFLKMWRIYVEAGFNSQSTYYRVFRKLVGCTPLTYKSRLSKINRVSFSGIFSL